MFVYFCLFVSAVYEFSRNNLELYYLTKYIIIRIIK